jgi:hypothetical protein
MKINNYMKNKTYIIFFALAIMGYIFGVFTSSPIAPIIWVPSLIIGIIRLRKHK